MRSEPLAPADTTMMRIVHDALRRDLHRAQVAFEASPPPPPEQQLAIARHLAWMMSFLRAHHHSEDVGLYPLVRERAPAAVELLDQMDADHRAVAEAIADVEAATSSPVALGSETRVIAALASLSNVLLPHLEREESEMMPVVSTVVTDAEWRQLEEQHNLEGKSSRQLGIEGHWLIDDAHPEDRRRVLGLVPAIPRFILVHGFGRSYRRRAAACWGSPRRRSRSVQLSGQCRVAVAADVDTVWDVVRDVTRVGEWSHECVGVDWLDGATTAAPGARFRGRNKQGVFRWGRVCEIVSAEPYELVWRTVPTALYPDSTEWKIGLRRSEHATEIEQSFMVVRGPKVLALAFGLLLPAHRDRIAALTEDLRRLGELCSNSATSRLPRSSATRDSDSPAIATPCPYDEALIERVPTATRVDAAYAALHGTLPPRDDHTDEG
jgi:hemerythrin-like domain-containing protein